MTDPHAALHRIAPDAVQLQIMLGSLLGDGRLVGPPGRRCMRIAHRVDRRDYVLWKYDRFGAFAAPSPRERDGVVGFETVVHPIFDDLARLFGRRRARHAVVERLLTPLGLAVWLADVGRLELRTKTFLPEQRALALAS